MASTPDSREHAVAQDVRWLARTVAIALSALAVVGCNSPSRPSTSVVAGRPASPSSDASLSYYSQPVTLSIATGVATSGASLTTTVEVATDAGFASIVKTQVVIPDASRQATVTLDHLAPSTTYYWRVRSRADDNAVVSATASFRMGPQLIIQPPSLVQPQAASVTHKRPTLTVANATHTGPDTTLTYQFEVATDNGFANVVATASVPEGPGETSFTPTADLPSGKTYYWRVSAADTSKNVVSGFSAALPFTTVNPDDGTYPYILHVRCSTRFGSNYDAPQNLLNVSGDSLQSTVASPATGYRLLVQMTRAGRRLAGTMSGSFSIGPPYVLDIGAQRSPVPYIWSPVGAARLSGEAADDGTLSGTFDGYAVIGYYPEVQECVGPYSWTLTSH